MDRVQGCRDAEILPKDQIRRAIEKLNAGKQENGSIDSYIRIFRRRTLAVPGNTAMDIWNKYIQGLDKALAVRIRESASSLFEESAEMALRFEFA